jgi:hypothetical protein
MAKAPMSRGAPRGDGADVGTFTIRLRFAADSIRRFKGFAPTTAHCAGGARLLCMGLFSQF